MVTMMKKAKRIHISSNANLVFESRSQITGAKPLGLWYGIGQSWQEWCEEEMPHWVHDYSYIIEPDLSKMLIISNEKEFEEFHKKYSSDSWKTYTWEIDWAAVAKDYDGIEISPYLPNFRMSTQHLWYYGWDIASGCIWHMPNMKMKRTKTITKKQKEKTK